jgi:uncharacterized membrane protein YjgN (DUF898 family)
MATVEHQFETRTNTGNFIWLVLKNWILGVVTLTLYRFWGRTELRKRIWSTTTVMGDPFEYTGKGWELFKGFLISLPFLLLPAIVIFLGSMTGDVNAYTWVIVLYYLALMPVFYMATYLMRRYQLSRTLWRGVRFSLGGSSVAFGFSAWLMSILESITLGWYAPASRMRRAKMLWENARFGDQPFEFANGEPEMARGLYAPFALGWFGTIITFFAFIGGVIAALAGLGLAQSFGGFGESGSEPTPAAMVTLVVAISGLYLGFFVLLGLVWMPYQAAAMRRIAELLELDGARFELRVKALELFGVTVAQIFIAVMSLGILAPLGAMWGIRYVMNRLTLVGEPRLAMIEQSATTGPKQGEGLADAFDLDIGIGII